MMKRLAVTLGAWRGALLVVVTVLLLASAGGTVIAFSQPGQVWKQVPVLKYEHQGKFDFVAQQKASYLAGDLPLESVLGAPPQPKAEEMPPQSNPKYPVDMIDRIDMTFGYALVADRPAQVSASIEIKGQWQKAGKLEETVLLPAEARSGDFAVSFSLDGAQLAASTATIVSVAVHPTIQTSAGPVFESFNQALALRLRGPLLEVDRNLTNSQKASFGDLRYTQTGAFDYIVRFKSDSPFGALTLKPPSPTVTPDPPPPAPARLSAKTLGPQDTVSMRLFDNAEITFAYRFLADGPVSQVAEEVRIDAVLENPGVWSKSVPLVPGTTRQGPFSVSFRLTADNLTSFNDIFRAIEKEIGGSVPRNIAIKAIVHTVAQTELGAIDETFVQTLTMEPGTDTLKWKEKLDSSRPGAIEAKHLVSNPRTFLGMTVSQLKSVSGSFAGVFLILLVSLIIVNVRHKPDEAQMTLLLRKRKDAFVDVQQLPETNSGDAIVHASSLDELVKASDSLLKPVLHKAGPDGHAFCIIDGATRYQYFLTLEGRERGPGTTTQQDRI